MRTNCGRHGFWPTMRASTDRRRGTNASPAWCKAQCARSSGQEEIKPHKVRYYLERRDAEFEQKMAEVLCVYREVQVLKEAAAGKSNKSDKPVAIVSYDEKPGIQAIATTAPDLPPEPGVHATFARDHEYKRHGTLSLLAGIDLLTGKLSTASDHRPGQHEFGLENRPGRLDPAVERCRHPPDRWMPNLPLDIGDDLPGIGLVPAPVQFLGVRLPEKSSGSSSPLFSRHSRSKAASSLPMMTRASEPPMK
jgi:hypothetical protein